MVRSCVAAVVPASLFQLAKASAAWDGGTARLLALTNKDSEKRSILFLTFFFLNSSLCFSLKVSVSILHIPKWQGFKLVLQPVLKSAFCINF